MRHLALRYVIVAGCLALAPTGFAQKGVDAGDRDTAPNGKGIGTSKQAGPTSNQEGGARTPSGQITPGAVTTSNGIYYHGGPVMTGSKNIYYIWYGNWSGNTAGTILTNLAQHIGGSPYFNINTTYTNGSGIPVLNSVVYGGSTTDNYSHGTNLSDSAVGSIVASAIVSGRLPLDNNGVYFVLTSKDVNETGGFCTQYCGWHTYGSLSGTNVKYSFVGNPDRCPSACEAQYSSPNNNPGADGMASIIAHELEETASDPNLNAWYDSRGAENADKCAWTWGAYSRASNGSAYNVTFGSLQYLIQQNWVNASGGYCSMKY